MSVFVRLSVLTILATALTSVAARSGLVSRQAVGGSEATGWTELPVVAGATVHSDWAMKGATMPLYLTTGTTEGDTSTVKRAVIVVPGKGRDCWYYWGLMDGTLKNYPDVNYDDVSIMAPCFLTDVDMAGAAVNDNILFGLTTWVSGHENTAPAGVETSAYEVLDELVNYYLDTTKFPALEAVVIAGHSAGGQMSQRYAALKKSGEGEDRIHYWVANPGSLVWLTEDRPAPNEACEGIDEYKYGLTDGFPAYALGDANSLGRDGLVDRYLGRKVHYAWGLEDSGPGDTRCQAVTQGASHLERGQNFVSMLDGLGGLPSTSTVDYIPGVSHQADGMAQSTEGMNKLFKYVG